MLLGPLAGIKMGWPDAYITASTYCVLGEYSDKFLGERSGS